MGIVSVRFQQAAGVVLDRGEVIERTAAFVRSRLHSDSSGHDWWHVERVRGLALLLGRREGADEYITELAALLHDVSDYKFNGGDLDEGSRVSYDLLRDLGESEACARSVAEVVRNVSFTGAGSVSRMRTIEGMVVQDADRLDAMGAIGIARAFAYGAVKGEAMFDPDQAPHLHASEAEYLARDGSTINHFYEKLLLLKDRMNTESGRSFAERRHRVIEAFVHDFVAEWRLEDLPEL
ncbi:HD domain-containing protein [Actinoallomurus sp. CA-142502]|uniref:Phosphohydrolase n=2 Tax=Actinoallomurus iriomotensis TaxID=478107 RepID=A0A9W6RUC3_9ACTN|nr:phosphohydrolase [Actinoallomurus iriomotensis]